MTNDNSISKQAQAASITVDYVTALVEAIRQNMDGTKEVWSKIGFPQAGDSMFPQCEVLLNLLDNQVDQLRAFTGDMELAANARLVRQIAA